jgi:hypothetical protein
MNSQDDQENKLRRREQELQAREHAIRLRELEAEITPLYQTVKHQEPESSRKRWYGKLVNVGKFLAIIVAVVVSIKIATGLASVIMVGAVAWVAYKLFLESDRSKR